MRVSAVIAAIVAFVLGTYTAPSAQLGEVARQEEARRKTIKAPGKVYTNESLQPAPPPSPGAVPVPRETETTPDTASADTSDRPDAKSEAYWRDRIKSERDALDRAQAFEAALESQINGLTTDFVNRDDPAQRAVIATNRDKALAELERVKKEVEQHTKGIADIQEEARRAGVPAGWVR